MVKPLWKAFDEVDKRVAGPVEAGAHSDVFGDLVARADQARPPRAARGRAAHPPRAARGQPADRDRRPPPLRAGRLAAAPAARPRGPAPPMSPSLAPADLLSRVERDVQRALQRSRNGLRYAAGTHAPEGRARRRRTSSGAATRRELWRYRSRRSAATARRCVIVHSLVSRSYVLDLYPGQQRGRAPAARRARRLPARLGRAGRGRRRQHARALRRRRHPGAVAAACETAGTDDVNLLGYCFGGVLACSPPPATPSCRSATSR